MNNANQQVKDLTFKISGYEGRMAELTNSIAIAENAKRDVNSQLINVAVLLRNMR